MLHLTVASAALRKPSSKQRKTARLKRNTLLELAPKVGQLSKRSKTKGFHPSICLVELTTYDGCAQQVRNLSPKRWRVHTLLEHLR